MIKTDNPKKQTVFPTILVVDDILENLFVFQQLIEQNMQYHQVLMTTDPREGFKMASTYHPDAILLDFQMPHCNGIELCRRLKTDKALADIPIVLITGNLVTPQLRAEGLEAGASDFIVKPINMGELIDKIKFVLKGKYCKNEFKKASGHLQPITKSRTKETANRF